MKSPAEQLLDKANKKIASSGWFSSSSAKFEEAGDLFQQAANAYKLDKQFKNAGDAYAREAECRENYKEMLEAANAWWNAAKAYRQGYPDLAVQALEHTIDHLTKTGRFRQAADRAKDIALIFLQDLNALQKACDNFERASEWYAQEDAVATANACKKDAADLHAELGNYTQAIANYEYVADRSLSSPLTKYSVKEYWMRATLCALAMNDTVAASRQMARYTTKDVTFSATREAKFVTVIIDAVTAGDQDSFTAAVVEFDAVTRFDNWKTSILIKIKNLIREEPGIL